VSGGPLFWLFFGMFVVAFYVMAWTAKAIVYLVAMIVREWAAARARKAARLGGPIERPPIFPAEPQDSVPAEPQDAVPHEW
jgi:hypothetical protein